MSPMTGVRVFFGWQLAVSLVFAAILAVWPSDGWLKAFMVFFSVVAGIYAMPLVVMLSWTAFLRRVEDFWDTAYFRYMRAFWGQSWSGKGWRYQIDGCRACLLSFVALTLGLPVLVIWIGIWLATALMIANGTTATFGKLLAQGTAALGGTFLVSFIMGVFFLLFGAIFLRFFMAKEEIEDEFPLLSHAYTAIVVVSISAAVVAVLIIGPMQSMGGPVPFLRWLVGTIWTGLGVFGVIIFVLGLAAGFSWLLCQGMSQGMRMIKIVFQKTAPGFGRVARMIKKGEQFLKEQTACPLIIQRR